ncbi:flagellar biosynthesis protein FlhA [Simiduia sp. 21SJ11W-1]|nr:flagellar biosynthesis protein FlhA [Simiduia sp. 21SJ11W-1]
MSHMGRGNLGIPLLLLMLLGMMTLPIPAFLLDVFFSFNIALSIVVLLVGVYALRPLDFAVFPTILLLATLLRLALNVASTRVVLLHGHEGGDAAGKVIQAFGEVVIGGNYAVGLVVFLILMIINFVVVTKGAGRISEVSARFTLDAMPGKQMAIDADLNAGLINQEEAKLRRTEVASEADFYGAMDGASKFVRGDAVAGILILLINVIGGLIVGMAQHNLEFQDAMQKYILLTIGDGLVAQIPSLLLSTSAAILVTRVNTSEDMSQQIRRQMFDSPKALAVSAGVLFIMGVIPGMPHVAFLGLATVAGGLAWYIHKLRSQGELVSEAEGDTPKVKAPKDAKPGQPGTEAQAALEHQRAPEPVEVSWDDVKPVDVIGLEVGYRLIPMVDKTQGGELLGRIRGVRKKMSQEVGFLVPTVHIRDNLDLLPNQYRVTLMGVAVAEEEVHPDRDLAINPGQVFGDIEGIAAKDPAFGLPSVWIKKTERDHAQTLGYTVVDASTVVATHLNQILSQHVSELLGLEDVQQLVDMLGKTSPKLAEHLVPESVSLKTLLKVLQLLLQENVSIKDMRSIAEAIAANSDKSQDPVMLMTAVRQAIARQIVQGLVGNDTDIPVFTLDPSLEQILLKTYQQSQKSGDGGPVIEPGLAEKLRESVQQVAHQQEGSGAPAILLVSGQIRYQLARFVRAFVPDMVVLAYNEIPANKQITIVGSVGA